MEQLKLIDKVRQVGEADNTVSAIMMYGSFIKGEGDRFSDIEFYVFTHQEVDKREWVECVAPVALFFQNEFGTDVAVFENLIRGEFHFHNISEIEMIFSWQGQMSFRWRDKMVIVDKEGTLKKILDNVEIIEPDYDTEYLEVAIQMLVNYLIFSKNLILRGETAHAHQLFFFIQRAILWLIRLQTGCTQHYESPTKNLENDIPKEWYDKFAGCIPILDLDNLTLCHDNALKLSSELLNMFDIPAEYKLVVNRIGSMK